MPGLTVQKNKSPKVDYKQKGARTEADSDWYKHRLRKDLPPRVGRRKKCGKSSPEGKCSWMCTKKIRTAC